MLDDLYDRPQDTATLREATERVMDAITALLGAGARRGAAGGPLRHAQAARAGREAGRRRPRDPSRAAVTADQVTHDRPHAPGAPRLRAAVLGAGAWGTTFAAVHGRRRLRRDGLGARREGVPADRRRAPQRGLPAGRRAARTASPRRRDARAVLAGADVVAVAIPSQSARATLTPLRRRRRRRTPSPSRS